MTESEFLAKIGIENKGEYGEDNSYVVDLSDSNEFGKIFTKLDKAEMLDPLEDNQVVTEQGTSLMYESEEESAPYILNLIADFDGDIYQLVVTKVEE